jgi:hypothetical protein
MTTTTSVFLPDEQEQKTRKRSAQSARPNAQGSDATDSADTYAEIRKLDEHELKAAIKSVWKKHEELAKQDLAPLLYYLREQLRAQGARNDLANADRGFAAWVEENLDISRRTVDRWCEWFAVAAGIKPGTSGQLSKSEDDDFYDQILDEHKGQEQIAFNCWVPKAVHGQFTKALVLLQKQLNVKNKKEAIVQGVIYAAKNVSSRSGKRPGLDVDSRGNRRRGGSAAHFIKGRGGHKQTVHGSSGHRGGSGAKAMRAAAGR